MVLKNGPPYFKNVVVLARPYLMSLYVIFPIHLNFPVRSRCVLKAIIHRKKTVDCFTVTRESFFIFKKTLFDMHEVFDNFSILSQFVLIFHLSLSIIYLLFKYLEELIVFLPKQKVGKWKKVLLLNHDLA